MAFTPRVIVPTNPYGRPAWIVPRDELVDFTHINTLLFYPRLEYLLQNAFHRRAFLPRQVAAINCAIQGFDLVLTLPTCGGKSLCYQLPAIYNTTAITIIFSPFTALIEDQIRALHALGPQWKIWAQRSHAGNCRDLAFSASHGPRIFYICPEWLDNDEHKETLYALARQDRIARIVVDEAHNVIPVTQTRTNPYRSAFRHLFDIRQDFPSIPFTLSSASLTLADQRALTFCLGGLGRFYNVSSPSLRKKFHQRVVHLRPHRRAEQKVAIIAKYMKDRPQAKGFVFVPTRKLAQTTAEKLQAVGIQAEWYHAGQPERLPDVIQRLDEGLIPVLVCTSAFGEGIDNKLGGFVFHYSLPSSMARYFQETGRIGRQGQRAECILLYSFSDIRPLVNVIAHDLPPVKSQPRREFLRSQRDDLQQVLEYCYNSFSCRRQQLIIPFDPQQIPYEPGIAMQNKTTIDLIDGLYDRALCHSFGPAIKQLKKEMDLDPIEVQAMPIPPSQIDADCDGCDVCDRRYRPATEQEEKEDEMSWFQLVTESDLASVENGFQNDTVLSISQLVKRVVGSPSGIKSKRAHEIVEFLAVTGVLRCVFPYASFGPVRGFQIKLERGNTKIDTIAQPVPVKWHALGPLKFPGRNRAAPRANNRNARGRRQHQRAPTEDTIISADGTVHALDSDEWEPDSEEFSSSDEDDNEDEGDEDEDEILMENEEDPEIRATPFEDGRGIRYPSVRPLPPPRASSSPELADSPRKSSSPELEGPPPPAIRHARIRPRSPEDDLESVVLSSPSKRRRVERREVSEPNERLPTDAEKMLKKFRAAVAKLKKADAQELLGVSETTLRRVFEKPESYVTLDGFLSALKQVGASKDDECILKEWYGWIIKSEVFVGRFDVSSKRRE